MTRALLVVSLCLPLVAAAQTTTGRWSISGAGGVGYTGAAGEAVGFAWGFSVRRDLSEHLAFRAVFDGAGSQSRSQCSPPLPPSLGLPFPICRTDPGASVFSGSLGVDWAPRHDRGLYGAGRVGLYSLGDAAGAHPGAYLGAGFALPLARVALVLETGLHIYAGRTQQNWVVPALLGLRWRW